MNLEEGGVGLSSNKFAEKKLCLKTCSEKNLLHTPKLTVHQRLFKVYYVKLHMKSRNYMHCV